MLLKNINLFFQSLLTSLHLLHLLVDMDIPTSVLKRLACTLIRTLRTRATAFKPAAAHWSLLLDCESFQDGHWVQCGSLVTLPPIPVVFREGRQPEDMRGRQKSIVVAKTQNRADSFEDFSRRLLWEETSCKDLLVVEGTFKLGLI